MRQDIKNWDTCRKMEFAKEIIKRSLGEIPKREISVILCRIAHKHNDPKWKTRELTEKEMIVYDCLLKEELNPATVYKWYLLTRTPDDVKQKLRLGIISQKKALKLNAGRIRYKEMQAGFDLMEQCRMLIRGI